MNSVGSDNTHEFAPSSEGQKSHYGLTSVSAGACSFQKGRICVSLLFPALKSLLYPLAHGLFPIFKSNCTASSNLYDSDHLASCSQEPYRLSWAHLDQSGQSFYLEVLNVTRLQRPFCHVTSHSYKFQELECEHFEEWGALYFAYYMCHFF